MCRSFFSRHRLCLISETAATYMMAGADTCGTTLTCVLAQQHRRPAFRLDVCVGNLGDSRVLKVRLGRNAGLCEERGTSGGVTVDHKPSLHEEKRRIEACGSVVVTAHFNVPRINGELALSRGLGDRRWEMAKNNYSYLRVLIDS